MTNTLKQNLELRKALAEVDRLTALNVELKNKIEELELRQKMVETDKEELYAQVQELELILTINKL